MVRELACTTSTTTGTITAPISPRRSFACAPLNVAAPTLADLAAAGRAPAAVEARLRFTAPFDMSGHPTLTLPGGKTDDGLPVGFQLVGRPMEEALVLRAGHAFQQATGWHRRRPPIS